MGGHAEAVLKFAPFGTGTLYKEQQMATKKPAKKAAKKVSVKDLKTAKGSSVKGGRRPWKI